MRLSTIPVIALAALANTNPVQIEPDIFTPNLPELGPLQDPVPPPYSPAVPSKGRMASDDLLDIQYGQCYRIKDSNDEKLGLHNNYYKFGGSDGNRAFRVCRESQGSCKHEGRNDQTIRRHEHFYLKDLQGSAYSNGASWMSSAGWYLWPLPKNYPQDRISRLWGYRVCTDPDTDGDGDNPNKTPPDCEICVSQRLAWNNYPGLTTQPNTKLILTSTNPDQCVYLKFTKVKCPSHMMGDDEVLNEDQGSKMLRLDF
ncbi:hypothetical protein BDV12DRAFT_207777 [Aspergillus spectabilis]